MKTTNFNNKVSLGTNMSIHQDIFNPIIVNVPDGIADAILRVSDKYEMSASRSLEPNPMTGLYNVEIFYRDKFEFHTIPTILEQSVNQ